MMNSQYVAIEGAILIVLCLVTMPPCTSLLVGFPVLASLVAIGLSLCTQLVGVCSHTSSAHPRETVYLKDE